VPRRTGRMRPTLWRRPRTGNRDARPIRTQEVHTGAQVLRQFADQILESGRISDGATYATSATRLRLQQSEHDVLNDATNHLRRLHG
jgi:hypothetical protein